MSDTRDLDIERFLADDPRMVAELPTRLGQDRELRRRLGAALLQDALLHQAMQTMPIAGRRREPRRAALWLAAAGIILAIGGGLWFLMAQQSAPSGPSTAIQVVAAQDAACDGHALGDGDLVPFGEVATGPSGVADLRLPRGGRIALSGSSRLRVPATGSLQLTAGRAACDITPHDPDAPFAIAMPGALAIAVGTRFTIAVPAEVTVDHGRVAMLTASGDAGILIAAGASAALADTAAWYRFPDDEDLLALTSEHRERACVLRSARRQVIATAQPVRLMVVQGLASERDLDRAALAQLVARRCVELRLPVTVVLGESPDLQHRIRAGGLEQLEQVLEALLRLDPQVDVRVSAGLEKGLDRVVADAISDLDERRRAVRGPAR